MAWDTVIGLEVHAQLKTVSKLFSGASTRFGEPPNSQTSYIDAGLPGVLPVLNEQAVLLAIRFGLAIDAEINDNSTFERKNYFYPDLPKGYQISQYAKPIVSNGYLTINKGSASEKKISILRAHLEEDAGKSLHDAHHDCTGIDLNRAGTPLLEIVTTPCIHSAKDAISYLKALHQLVRFLAVCDGNMQEGSFRCDVNISLKPKGSKTLGTRTELKNLNSFRFIEKAISYETARQQDLLEQGKPVIQQTRLFDPATETTQLLRMKESENDYRYVPDPDLLPVRISQKEIDTVRRHMPQLPKEIRSRLEKNESLTTDDVSFVLSSPAVYSFFVAINEQTKAEEKMVINWLKGIYSSALNEDNRSFEKPPVSAELMASLLDKLTEKTLSNHMARQIFARLWAGEKDIDSIIEQHGFSQTDDDEAALKKITEEIVQQYPQQATEYRAGKEKLLAFFVGQVMKQTKGKANPEKVSAWLKEALK